MKEHNEKAIVIVLLLLEFFKNEKIISCLRCESIDTLTDNLHEMCELFRNYTNLNHSYS